MASPSPRSRSLLALGALLLLAAACSKEPDEPEPLGKEGEACQVAKDCVEGLTCRELVCTALNVMDMDREDGLADADMGAEMGPADQDTMVEAEEYVISFLRKVNTGADKGRSFLYTVNTADGEVSRVSDDPSLCSSSCWLSEDLSTFVYTVQVAGLSTTFDVYTVSVDQDLKVNGSGTVFVAGAESVLFTGDAVTYMKLEGNARTAYAKSLGATQPIVLGNLELRETQTQDSWALNQSAERSVIFSPTLQTLSVRLGKPGTSINGSNEIYLIDASNYQMTSGAYFGTSIPSAISPDGRYLAVLTDAPNNYNSCTSNAECDAQAGQHCGEKGVCTVRELTVRFFDLENLSELPNSADAGQDGKNCDTDSQCSAAHECYIPANTQLDEARCVPRRVTLGMQGQLKQPRIVDPPAQQKLGCELTAAREVARYTSASSRLTFGPDNALYLTAERDCGEGNMPDSDVLRIEAEGGDVSVVTGNARERFDDARCYDDNEGKIDTSDCVIYIEQAALSPLGRELALLATHPGTTTPEQADSKLDVWTVRRDGSHREWIGEGTIFDEGRRLMTHPPK